MQRFKGFTKHNPKIKNETSERENPQQKDDRNTRQELTGKNAAFRHTKRKNKKETTGGSGTAAKMTPKQPDNID